jgi:hypothetical protein
MSYLVLSKGKEHFCQLIPYWQKKQEFGGSVSCHSGMLPSSCLCIGNQGIMQ